MNELLQIGHKQWLSVGKTRSPYWLERYIDQKYTSEYKWKDCDSYWQVDNNAPCYAILGGRPIPELIITRPDYVNRGVPKSFIYWLMSDLSPWKPFWDAQKLITKDLDPYPYTIDGIYEHGFLIADLKHSAPAVLNALIGSRTLAELYTWIPTWDILLKEGIHPNVAFVLLHYHAPFPPEKVYLGTIRSGHTAMSTCMSRQNIRNFINQKGDFNFKIPYSENSYYNSSSKIWGASGDTYVLPKRGYISLQDFIILVKALEKEFISDSNSTERKHEFFRGLAEAGH